MIDVKLSKSEHQRRRLFFTVVTYRRQRFLCDETVRNALREGIKATQATHPFTIDAWVLLPDHLHCIWTLPPDEADFGVRWAMIKRFVTKQCGSARVGRISGA